MSGTVRTTFQVIGKNLVPFITLIVIVAAPSLLVISRGLDFLQLPGTAAVALVLPLLLTPMILFLVAFGLAIPAAVVERKTPIAAFRRSARLTRGYRWKLFGILALWYVMDYLAGSFVKVLPTEFLGQGSFSDAENWISWVFIGVLAAMTSVAYHDLRYIKDDMDSASLGEVFE